VPVRLTINKDILEASRQYIPNLSQFFEEKLIEFLKYLNRPITKDFYGSARIRTGDLLRVRDSKIEELNQINGEIKFSEGILKDYLEHRFSQVNSEKSKYWIEKGVREYIKRHGYVLSKDRILKYQNWFMQNFGYEGQRHAYLQFRAFLKYLYKITKNPVLLDFMELMTRPKRQSKKINQIILREPDVLNLVEAVYKLPPSPYDPSYRSAYHKLKFIAGILFSAYTGQRPQATTGKLTFKDFEEALERDPPILWIPEEKDKESFPHWVPLHPVVVEWLTPVLEFKELSQSDRPFPYDSLRKLIDSLNIKATHTGRKITYSHLRKFFEQMCNNVLMVHPGLRDYIMAHNTGSLDVQSYDGKLPKEIYEQYMEKWKDVNLVPENVDLEELLEGLRRE